MTKARDIANIINDANFGGTLDVTGVSTLSGLAYPSSDGSANQFIKTNGSGALSFATVDLTALSASNLTSGTVPDARFPATLPAISGANLTNLDATDLTGTIASARVSGAYTGITSVGTLTGFTSTGIDDNADATAITIDSSERVGIGASPTQLLDVVGSSANIRVAESGGGDLRMNVSGSTGGIGTHSNHPLIFRTNSTERMRIDSSGYALVGTTDNSPENNSAGATGDNGIALSPYGYGSFSRYASNSGTGIPLFVNRTSADGSLVEFRKNGSNIGNITYSSATNIAIGNAGKGIGIGTGSIFPTNGSTAISDAGLDLGYSSSRFKDLYLSGNINISDGSISSGVSHTYNLFGATGTGGSASYVTYSFVGDDNTGMFSGTADTLKFATGGSERMRIDSSGHLLVGTTTSFNALNGRGDIVAGNGSSNGGMTIFTGSSNQGSLVFADGTSGDQAYRGMVEYDHSNDTMAFKTAATERMRLTSGGAMTMGTTSSLTDVSGITLKHDDAGAYPTLLFLQNQPGSGGTMGADIHMGYASDYGTILRFFGNPFNSRPGGLQVRRVTGSGTSDLSMEISGTGELYVPRVYTNTTGNGANVFVGSNGQFERSTSSQRYKNTVNDATYGLAELLTLRPVTYKNNNDGDIVFGGLIAEEVHDAGLTEFVQYDDDGQPDALAYGNMVSLCIKAIQELKAENTALANRITTLEGA